MTVRAKSLAEDPGCPHSWLRVERGNVCDLTLRITDCESGIPVNWVGHRPRFRVYSQLIDGAVVFESTDSTNCVFKPDGIWRLRLAADQTIQLPRGGMRFTLEHRDVVSESQNDYLPGLLGGISCRDIGTRNDSADQPSSRIPKHLLHSPTANKGSLEHS